MAFNLTYIESHWPCALQDSAGNESAYATQAMHDAHVGRYVMCDRKEKLGLKDKAWVCNES